MTPPAWAMAGGSGATPQPLQPPSEGLILWLKGDAGVSESGGLMTAWADQSGFAQDFSADSGNEPQTGVADIDGVNCMTCPSGSTAYVQRAGGILDRNGNLMGYGVGETQPLTVMAVFRPGETSFDFFGGVLFHRVGTTGPPFQALLDLEHTNRPDGFWLASTGWRDYAVSNRGPDTPPSTYDGIPTMGQWSSSAFPNVDVRVNNAAIALTPSTLQGSIGGPTTARAMVGNCLLVPFGLAFVADIAELIVWDYELGVAARDQAVDYFRSRYPSVPVT